MMITNVKGQRLAVVCFAVACVFLLIFHVYGSDGPSSIDSKYAITDHAAAFLMMILLQNYFAQA